MNRKWFAALAAAVLAGLLLWAIARRNDTDDLDARAASDGDSLRCKRGVFLGIGKKKNDGYCECESWYKGQNPGLEASCKAAVRSRGEKFGSQASFEATLSKETLSAQQQAGQQQLAVQATQTELLKAAAASGTAADTTSNTPIYAAVGGVVLLVVIGLVWKFLR